MHFRTSTLILTLILTINPNPNPGGKCISTPSLKCLYIRIQNGINFINYFQSYNKYLNSSKDKLVNLTSKRSIWVLRQDKLYLQMWNSTDVF